jgi:hypothetical protein
MGDGVGSHITSPFLVSPVLLLVMPRFLLSSPVGKSMGFWDSWRLTRGNTLRLLLLVVLLPGVAIGLLLYLFDGLPGVFVWLMVPIYAYLFAVEVAVLSFCYKALTSDINPENQADI